MTAIRSLDRWTWLLVAVAVSAFALWAFAPAEASPRAKAKVTYIRCGAGKVHIWLYGDNGIFVMPAGSDCP